MSRPREFDEEAALDAAMRVFWTHGYDGASLVTLTEAMGINKPSLYAAFGNKEALFRRALDRYMQGPSAGAAKALEAPTARAAVEQLFDFYAHAPEEVGRPRGCLTVNGALRCADENKPAEAITRSYRDAIRLNVQKRLERGRRDGEPLPGKPAELARWICAVLNGMAIAAVDGATTDDLRKMAERALISWR